jgi:hypothetical protein
MVNSFKYRINLKRRKNMSKFNVAEDAAALDTVGELDGTEIIEISKAGKGGRIAMSQVHALELTPVNGVASAGKLTSSGAMVAGTHAVSVLTSDTTNQSEGDTVTIGTTVYTFRADPTLPYDIDIGVSAEASLDNLFQAIKAGTGEGTSYGTGTLAHPDVMSTDANATTLTIQAKIPGTVPNSIATTEEGDHTSWADTTLGGGTGASVAGVTTAGALLTIGSRVYTIVDELSETAADAIVDQILYGANEASMIANFKLALNAGASAGTNYSTGTVVNALVVGGASDATTMVITAKVKGTAGDDIATLESLANTVFDDVTLGTEVAGVDGTVGKKGQTAFDATNIYICKVDSGTGDTGNWRKVAHGAI